jgi:hypothetical protein
MDKYTCFFVDQDEGSIFEDAITLQLESDSPEGAAKEYLNQHGPIGPYIKVCLRDGYGDYLFPVKDFGGNPEERQATKKEQAAEIKQAEAKSAAQSSLSSTDLLLKELIKEQKSTNGKIDRIYWLLLVLTGVAIMPIYRLLKKWDSF